MKTTKSQLCSRPLRVRGSQVIFHDMCEGRSVNRKEYSGIQEYPDYMICTILTRVLTNVIGKRSPELTYPPRMGVLNIDAVS